MIKRHITRRLIELLNQFPVVGIIGARQVGKTTLAKSIIEKLSRDTIYLDLELTSDLVKLEEPELYLNQYSDKLIIIDEIQRMPELYPLLRSLVDQNRIPGRFLILGSASPGLIRNASESLAGRIYYLELSTLHFKEIYPEYDMIRHLFRGGFPNALLAENDQLALDWLDAFIQTYTERDLPLLGMDISPQLIKRFWTMLAHFHGGIWNASSFSRALGFTHPTMNKYLDYLEGALLLRRLYPFYPSIKKRLVKAPKVYIRDSGVLHRLVGISSIDQLQGNVLVGASWEGYVIEQISNIIKPDITLYFYRTYAGSEIDLVFVKSNMPVASVEIKYSNAPALQKGHSEAIKDLEIDNNFIVTPDSDDYLKKSNLRVCSLHKFINNYLLKL